MVAGHPEIVAVIRPDRCLGSRAERNMAIAAAAPFPLPVIIWNIR